MILGPFGTLMTALSNRRSFLLAHSPVQMPGATLIACAIPELHVDQLSQPIAFLSPLLRIGSAKSEVQTPTSLYPFDIASPLHFVYHTYHPFKLQ
mmetsp:Transcript_6346/g.12646  ORF Transcript_6346/g.12646 Transcript_6346/m.12646 type:complete len:95 (+) Transcript_6346:1096-1380(+)